MLAEQALRDGDVEGALSHLQDAVRKDPANAKLRVFLFQLLTVMGRWERAMTQLKLSGEMDAGALAMVQTYREALKCEGAARGGLRRPKVAAGLRQTHPMDRAPARGDEALGPGRSTRRLRRSVPRPSSWRPRPPAKSMARLSNGSPMPISAWGRY